MYGGESEKRGDKEGAQKPAVRIYLWPPGNTSSSLYCWVSSRSYMLLSVKCRRKNGTDVADSLAETGDDTTCAISGACKTLAAVSTFIREYTHRKAMQLCAAGDPCTISILGNISGKDHGTPTLVSPPSKIIITSPQMDGVATGSLTMTVPFTMPSVEVCPTLAALYSLLDILYRLEGDFQCGKSLYFFEQR